VASAGLPCVDGHQFQRPSLEWADLEIDNIRAVLQRCLARADAEVGIDVAARMLRARHVATDLDDEPS
jgi:hypothetical protein